MSHINPSREQYKPDDDLKVAGTFAAICVDVQQGIPWPDYPTKTRIAIQFQVVDDRYPAEKGRKTAIVCGESVYRPRGGGKPSRLYQYAIQMGIVSPEHGFDPEVFMDHWYLVTTEMYEGRAYVRSAVPIAPPPKNATIRTSRPPAAPTDVPPDDPLPF